MDYHTLVWKATRLIMSALVHSVVCLVVLLVTLVVYRLFLHPLSRVPGPKLAALSNIWQANHVRHGRMLQLAKALHDKYGPAVRVGPNEVWFDDKDAFGIIYSAGHKYEKSGFYFATALNKPTIDWRLNLHFPDTLDFLSEFDVKRYRLQRRLIGPLYQASSMKKYEHAVGEVIRQAIIHLRELDGAEVDLKEWMHILAVECLGAVVLSWSPGYIHSGSDGGTSAQGYISWKRKSVFGLFPIITAASFFWKDLGRHFSNIWDVTYTTPKSFKPFFTPVYQKISKRINIAVREKPKPPLKKSKANSKDSSSPEQPRKDLLSELIQLHKDRPEFTETYLRRLAMTNFGAGHETMCSALTSAMAMIGSHPDVQRKIASEVRHDSINSGSNEQHDNSAVVVPYPYTLASIKEAQRLYPVIGMSLSRRVPAGGMTIQGRYFQAGTTVGCNPVALHRNTDIFGPDADKYRPERWFLSSTSSPQGEDADMDQEGGGEEETQRIRAMERYNLTWGGGGRTCPGRHLAEMVIHKIVPALLKEFDVEVTYIPPDEEVKYYFMAMLTGVRARFVPVDQPASQ